MNSKPHLNQMAQEFTPMQQQRQMYSTNVYQPQTVTHHQLPTHQQQAALQAAMMNPAALQAMIQNQNPQLLHQLQHQQLQQLQQLHQQNLRLAAAFNQNQMGIYNATSALLNQLPNGQQQQQQEPVNNQLQQQGKQQNGDFDNFPTREDYSPSPPLLVAPKCPKTVKSKDHNKDSAFDDISDDSSESTGSSYTNVELEAHEIPDEATLDIICRQVEEYLSDQYLSTDKYLLRQLRSKSEGYLSVKLLTSFKKIKKLTRDWRVTAHALKRSNLVELSCDGHRVKRHAHLPDNLRRGRTMTSILAIRVPEDWATLESITNLFSTYGNITLARVLRPGRPIPPDLRNYATQIPDMGASTCAVVDFESTDSAHECCRGLRDKNLRGMRIALLGPRIRRTLYKAEKKKVPENRHQRRQNAGMVISNEQNFKLNQAVNQKAPGVSKEEGKNHFEISLIPNRRNSLSKNSQNLEINKITMDGPFKRPVQTSQPVPKPVHNLVQNHPVQNLIPNRRSPSNSPNRSNFSTNPKIYPNKIDQTFRSTLWSNPDETTTPDFTQNFTQKISQNFTPRTPQNFTSKLQNFSPNLTNNLNLNSDTYMTQAQHCSFDPLSQSTSGFISGSTSGFEIDYINGNTHKTNVPDNLGLKIIQSYFHGQVKPDDPLDFPPLGHPNLTNQDQPAACPTPVATNSTWNLASQMKKMVIEQKKPTMSEIVKAQNEEIEAANQDILSDGSDESGRGSPKPVNLDFDDVTMTSHSMGKKSWNFPTAKTEQPIEIENDTVSPPVWDPWNFRRNSVQSSASLDNDDNDSLETDMSDLIGQKTPTPAATNQNDGIKKDELKFEPLPTIDIGSSGIWSSMTTGISGW